jgi:kynurenine formamidase
MATLPEPRRVQVSADEFRALFDEVCAWRRWGAQGERGALNYLTADLVVAATRLVRNGTTVSLGHPLNTTPRVDNPQPAVHRMTMLHNVDIGSGSVRFAKDYIGVDYHNDGHSHIDALSHVAFQGRLFDGEPDDSVTAHGAEACAIDVLSDGLVGRGVLLDVPRVWDVAWLEPGQQVFREDLEAAERSQGVQVGTGDILLVRTGHSRRLADMPPWDTGTAKAGLHPTAALFLADRQIAALGSDGNSDAVPSSTEGIGFPFHVLAVNAMGIHLLDYLDFEELAGHCARMRRWEFLFVAAPLRITGGTGSPLNPLVVL